MKYIQYFSDCNLFIYQLTKKKKYKSNIRWNKCNNDEYDSAIATLAHVVLLNFDN